MAICFGWDDDKNQSNRRKHGVSFEVAMRVFEDPLHMSCLERVVDGALRYQTLGAVGGQLIVLLVAHTLQEDEEGTTFIRIISARKATPREREDYEQQ